MKHDMYRSIIVSWQFPVLPRNVRSLKDICHQYHIFMVQYFCFFVFLLSSKSNALHVFPSFSL